MERPPPAQCGSDPFFPFLLEKFLRAHFMGEVASSLVTGENILSWMHGGNCRTRAMIRPSLSLTQRTVWGCTTFPGQMSPLSAIHIAIPWPWSRLHFCVCPLTRQKHWRSSYNRITPTRAQFTWTLTDSTALIAVRAGHSAPTLDCGIWTGLVRIIRAASTHFCQSGGYFLCDCCLF